MIFVFLVGIFAVGLSYLGICGYRLSTCLNDVPVLRQFCDLIGHGLILLGFMPYNILNAMSKWRLKIDLYDVPIVGNNIIVFTVSVCGWFIIMLFVLGVLSTSGKGKVKGGKRK
jgi:hypothetical protein